MKTVVSVGPGGQYSCTSLPSSISLRTIISGQNASPTPRFNVLYRLGVLEKTMAFLSTFSSSSDRSTALR